MPLMEVTAPSDALSPSQRDVLMKKLTDCVLTWEGVSPENEAAQSIAWAYYRELPASMLYVGGQPSAAASGTPCLRFDITTPEGTLDDSKRAGLVADIAALVRDCTEATLRHWVLLHEVPDGSWGARGRIFRRNEIVAAVANSNPSREAGA